MLNGLKLTLIESTDVVIFYSAPALGNFHTSGQRDKLLKGGSSPASSLSFSSNRALASNIRNQRIQNPLSQPPTDMLLWRQLTQFNSVLMVFLSVVRTMLNMIDTVIKVTVRPCLHWV